MPAIRDITTSPGSVSFTGPDGVTHTLTDADIPGVDTTPAQVEAWLTLTLGGLASNMAISVHVFSLNPMMVAIRSTPVGQALPANWWNR